MNVQTQVVIIGGGITGMTAAYRLSERGMEVTVVEPRRVGGVIETSRADGFTLEHGPNVLLSKPELLALIEELGLSDRVVYPAVPKYRQEVWWNGQPLSVPKGPGAFLQTPLLSLGEKISLVSKLFKKGVMTPEAEDESVATFMGRLLGSRLTKDLLDPVLKGIYGGQVSKLSARSLFGSLWEHAASGGSLIGFLKARKGKVKPEAFVLKGGLSSLSDTLRTKVISKARIVEASVLSVSSGEVGFEVIVEGQPPIASEHVLITTAGSDTAGMLSAFDAELSDALKAVRYSTIVVLHYVVPASQGTVPLDSFGVLFPEAGGFPLLGVMYNSVLFPHLAPSGEHLITVCLGGVGQEGLCRLDDSELMAQTSAEVERRLGIKTDRCLSVRRWERAIPQYELGHYRLLEQVRAVEDRYPGLHLLGADQMGVGVPDRVRVATDVANGIAPRSDKDEVVNG